MSGWRLVVSGLHQLGRPATNAELQDAIDADGYVISSGLLSARRWKLIRGTRNGQLRATTWELTELGVAFAEGRRAQVEVKPGGRRWVATWLESLPRGLRLSDAAD